MYREYALTLKCEFECVECPMNFFFFQKERVRVIVRGGRRDDHWLLVFFCPALRVKWWGVNVARDCGRVILTGETLRELFFLSLSLSLPSSFSFVTIVRDRSRKSMLRNKSIWHIFFQLLDTLPVCQDFNRQVCNRPACKFIHLSDGEFSRSAATWRAALIPWLMESEAYISHSSHR